MMLRMRNLVVLTICSLLLSGLPARSHAWSIAVRASLTDTPRDLVVGADGNLWIAMSTSMAKVTPTGVVKTYNLNGSKIGSVALSTDGAVWFTDPDSPYIGRITTNGTVSTYIPQHSNGSPQCICAGQNGMCWFTDGSLNVVGGIDPATRKTYEIPVPTPGCTPAGICLGPDNCLWFCE